METLQPFFHKDSGAFWCGKLRAGVTGITAVCLELDDPESDFIQDRPKITVARAGGFFVKRYNLPGFFTQLRRLFKTSRLQSVLRGAEHLNKLGIQDKNHLFKKLILWRMNNDYLLGNTFYHNYHLTGIITSFW